MPPSLTDSSFDAEFVFDKAASWRRGCDRSGDDSRLYECGYHTLLALAERQNRLVRLTGRY